jgi:DNA (cytosine-5)-methyltransferase 1
MTRGGRLFPLPASVLRTIADVFSSSRNLPPTPTTSDGNGPGQAPNRQGGRNLNTTLLPTPTVDNNNRPAGATEPNLKQGSALLPTPQAVDGKFYGMSVAVARARFDDPGRQNGLHEVVFAKLLPTPMSADNKQTTLPRRERDGRVQTDTVYRVLGEWVREDGVVEQSDYTPALDRWAAVLGRPHPDPTVPHPDHGCPQLNPRFVEWMMGLPDGWVTDVPGVSRRAQLKMLGNGVVPQQATAILKLLDDGW